MGDRLWVSPEKTHRIIHGMNRNQHTLGLNTPHVSRGSPTITLELPAW